MGVGPLRKLERRVIEFCCHFRFHCCSLLVFFVSIFCLFISLLLLLLFLWLLLMWCVCNFLFLCKICAIGFSAQNILLWLALFFFACVLVVAIVVFLFLLLYLGLFAIWLSSSRVVLREKFQNKQKRNIKNDHFKSFSGGQALGQKTTPKMDTRVTLNWSPEQFWIFTFENSHSPCRKRNNLQIGKTRKIIDTRGTYVHKHVCLKHICLSVSRLSTLTRLQS